MACEDPGGQDWETYFEEGDEQCPDQNECLQWACQVGYAVEGLLETQWYAHSRIDREH